MRARKNLRASGTQPAVRIEAITVSRISKAITSADTLGIVISIVKCCGEIGRIARLDQQHTQIYEDKTNLNKGHQCSVLGPVTEEKQSVQTQHEERNTDEEGHKDSSLLKPVSDEQHPSLSPPPDQTSTAEGVRLTGVQIPAE
eukprot:1625226-Prymnesium_polylepis.1